MIKKCVIKDLFGILVIVIVNVMLNVMWCECDVECKHECKTCDISEYLDYENCKCRKKLVDKLVDECAETVEEVKVAKITLAKNENKCKRNSCTLYIVFLFDTFYN